MDKEQPGEQRGAPQAPPEKSPGSHQAFLQQEDPSEQPSLSSQPTVTEHAAPFNPREFYLHSSAFRRYSRQRQPLVISSRAGTSRSLLLTSPPLRRWRPWDPSVAPKPPKKPESPPPKLLKPLEGPRGRRYTGKQELLFLQEFPVGAKRHSSSISSVDSDLTSILLQRQVLSHFPRWSSTPSVEPLGDRSLSFLRAESQLGSSQEHRHSARASSLVMPTSVEEVIASLHSEAQLAADRHFKELVRSILGPTCDLESDVEDIDLRKLSELKPPEQQAEAGLQTPQQHVSEEIHAARSSSFHIEPEDILDLGVSDTESMTRFQETLEIVPVSEFSKPLESEPPAGDSKAAKRIFLKEESSELLQIRGKEIKHVRKIKFETLERKRRKSLRFLKPKKLPMKRIPGEYTVPTLHALCRTAPTHQLPFNLSLASRIYHTPNRKGHNTLVGQLGASLFDSCLEEEDQKDSVLYGIRNIESEEENTAALTISPVKPPKMSKRTRKYAHKPQLQLLGEEMSAYPVPTKFLWTSAAPKFSVPVSIIKETVYPKYESAQASRILLEKFSIFKKQRIISSNALKLKHFILKKSASFDNIPKHYRTEFPQPQRAKSAINLRKEEETTVSLNIKNDMQSNIKEVLLQRAKELERYKAIQIESDKTVKENIDTILDRMQEKLKTRNLSVSLIEASRQAGISYIVYPRKIKKKITSIRFNKSAIVFDELTRPPKILKRSTSHDILPGQKKLLYRIPVYERQIRSPSLPTVLNFDEFVKKKGGKPKILGLRSWIFKLFSKYKIQKEVPKIIKIISPKEYTPVVKKLPNLELSDSLESDLSPEVIKHYTSEVEQLTEEINNKTKHLAFSYCRRGAIYRKLGKLQSAMNDLEEAVRLEPLFLNAYWHRHFIYLFQDKVKEALDDLNYINKHNKNNAEVYLSKAEIFKANNEITLAILSYTQAIKCKPTDADIYFRRGELYEMENRVLAIDDFSKCIFYDPKRTDALMKRGLFHFENEMWMQATQDFTDLLNVNPQDSQARTYRGRVYYNRHLFTQAAEDFSFAIHLDPNNWLALYYRACLFRKTNPLRALQDYSVSALINDGYENLNCFLHRGILYADLHFWMLAICDFETIISLERTFVVAYINIGLIYLLHLDNYFEAIWNFSEVIKIDPLHIQSYVCRAKAYDKLHRLPRSVKEITRAIHLQPDEVELYIIRGQYLLRMKNLDLAKLTIKQVIEMNTEILELSPVQQALVYSFCDKHEKAIQVLDGITLQKPEITTYTLLAKTQMKAKRNKEALKMFKKALGVFSHSSKGPDAIAASADCFYHLGICYVEEGNFQMAYDCFTRVVKAKPDFAEGFYQRGLCKVKLGKTFPILDFNRAITLDSNHYQAYLSRAAYYGMKGRYSKAILNCNEAIKICPQSVFAYIYRGVLKFYNRALLDYGTVLLLDAGETVQLNTFINRGRVYTELEQYQFALEDFKTAAQMIKTDVNLYHATAMCHHRVKEFEEAVNFFNKTLKLSPHFIDAYIGRGNSYLEYGNDKATRQAQKDFIRALHFSPANTRARISFAYYLQAQEKFQKAWNHFTIAIEIDPKCYKAFEGRAVVCLQMGDYFAAIQDINIAIKINTTAEFLTNRGVIHEFMGQQQNAMKDYQAAISLNPTYSLAYFNAGNIYFHHRQFSQACNYFSKALHFDPENECAALNRAIVNTLLKKYKEAKEDFAHIAEICPLWSAVYFNRAHLYCCLKQFVLAEEDYSKALTLKPNDPIIYHLRAEVRGKLGLIKEAIADYNKALDLRDYALS